MEEIRSAKEQLRKDIAKKLGAMTEKQRAERLRAIETRLYDFANFLEARIALLYMAGPHEVRTQSIIRNALDLNKIIVLPAFKAGRQTVTTLKVDNPGKDLIMGPRGVLEPDPASCKPVPLQRIDIAIIPGLAFDEKGVRLGSGQGYYDRFIPELPITTRKVALAFEEQIVPQIPTEPHDRHVDIIITNKRVIYKI